MTHDGDVVDVWDDLPPMRKLLKAEGLAVAMFAMLSSYERKGLIERDQLGTNTDGDVWCAGSRESWR